MKINIENKTRTVSDLFFANHATTPGILEILGGNNKISKIIIPLYQRDYDWDQQETLKLLDDSESYINMTQNRSEYFIGTILLEKLKCNHEFELVDGQQRITTTFLLNYLSYIISKYRVLKLPVTKFSSKKLIREIDNRFNKVKDSENRILIKMTENAKNDGINLDEVFNADLLEDLEDNKREEKIEERFNISTFYKYYQIKLHHEDINQRSLFEKMIKESKLEIINNKLELTEISNNAFSERISDIYKYLMTHNKGIDIDETLGNILKKISDYCEVLSFCVIATESPDDSFKLFEVLNSRGRTLTIIDKLKSTVYQDTVKVNPQLLTDIKFQSQWARIIEIQNDLKGNSNKIIKDLAASEGGTLKNNFFQYFNNDTIYNLKRNKIFISEDRKEFLNRITSCSELLNKIYDSNKYSSVNVSSQTVEWYAKIISDFGYDWGRQIIIGSQILSSYLKQNKIWEGKSPLWKVGAIDEITILQHKGDLDKFYIILFDLITKIGVIGIINRLSSRKLPEVSQDIIKKILDFVDNIGTTKNLKKLAEEIILISNNYITKEKNDFETRIKSLTYSSKTDRINMTKLLFILYNRGKGNSFSCENPSLEHFEPQNTTLGVAKYFKPKKGNPDREDYVNSFGNMILMKKNLNSKLGNLTIEQKIKKIKTDPMFMKETFFTHDIYRNLDPSENISGTKGPYTKFPTIDKKKAYNKSFVPQESLFDLRRTFYVENIISMVCNSEKYLLSGDDYLLPK
tara:strand:- start:574 stop:2808 length:2235 start_codon:yes stop_codon:yes gene_type:complete